jgi:hypothetical protein
MSDYTFEAALSEILLRASEFQYSCLGFSLSQHVIAADWAALVGGIEWSCTTLEGFRLKGAGFGSAGYLGSPLLCG